MLFNFMSNKLSIQIQYQETKHIVKIHYLLMKSEYLTIAVAV